MKLRGQETEVSWGEVRWGTATVFYSSFVGNLYNYIFWNTQNVFIAKWNVSQIPQSKWVDRTCLLYVNFVCQFLAVLTVSRPDCHIMTSYGRNCHCQLVSRYRYHRDLGLGTSESVTDTDGKGNIKCQLWERNILETRHISLLRHILWNAKHKSNEISTPSPSLPQWAWKL
jgi:hypothetical protein